MPEVNQASLLALSNLSFFSLPALLSVIYVFTYPIIPGRCEQFTIPF